MSSSQSTSAESTSAESTAQERHPVAIEKIVSLCARRGFIFQSSEIYGGINGFWDYGPLGVELKNNLKTAWWNRMVRGRADVEGVDCSIVCHPRTWEASGHVDNFSDPMVGIPLFYFGKTKLLVQLGGWFIFQTGFNCK